MVPGLPCVPTVSRWGDDSQGSSQTEWGCLEDWQKAAQWEASLFLLGCPEQGSTHTIGHKKDNNAAAPDYVPCFCMVCYCWYRHGQFLALNHCKRCFFSNQDVVIPWLPICRLPFEGRWTTPIPYFFLLYTFSISSSATEKKKCDRTKVTWVRLPEFSVYKHSHSSTYDYKL